MPQCKYGNEATRATAKDRTIRRHNAKQCVCYREHEASNAKNAPTGESETHNPDGSSNYTRFSEQPWGHDDYRAFIASKGQDPDKVTFSWGWTSNATGTGFWNKLNNVRPVAEAEAGINYADLSEQVRSWEPKRTVKGDSPTTYVVSLADWQLGKSERGQGTASTVERIKRSLAAIVEDIRGMQSRGSLPRSLLLANMGDHTENVYSSYASQTFTVDLNLRDQINLALELNLLWIKTLSPYFEEVIYSACLCNHGQLTRQGGKTNMTDDADNSTGLIGDTLQTLCKLHPELAHVVFEVPREEMITLVTVNGVNIAMSHGHKVTGNEATWLAKQAQNLAHRRNFLVDIWLLAHKHHASLIDLGPYTRIQATTVDPGSKHYEDMSGMYSRPGTTVFISGEQLPGKWDHYRIH